MRRGGKGREEGEAGSEASRSSIQAKPVALPPPTHTHNSRAGTMAPLTLQPWLLSLCLLPPTPGL